LTLVFDLPVELALARVRARAGVAERFDAAPLQERVAAGYRAALSTGAPGVVRIDAEASVEAVTLQLLSAIDDHESRISCL
jgi:thymidylate kinase